MLKNKSISKKELSRIQYFNQRRTLQESYKSNYSKDLKEKFKEHRKFLDARITLDNGKKLYLNDLIYANISFEFDKKPVKVYLKVIEDMYYNDYRFYYDYKEEPNSSGWQFMTNRYLELEDFIKIDRKNIEYKRNIKNIK